MLDIRAQLVPEERVRIRIPKNIFKGRTAICSPLNVQFRIYGCTYPIISQCASVKPWQRQTSVLSAQRDSPAVVKIQIFTLHSLEHLDDLMDMVLKEMLVKTEVPELFFFFFLVLLWSKEYKISVCIENTRHKDSPVPTNTAVQSTQWTCALLSI